MPRRNNRTQYNSGISAPTENNKLQHLWHSSNHYTMINFFIMKTLYPFSRPLKVLHVNLFSKNRRVIFLAGLVIIFSINAQAYTPSANNALDKFTIHQNNNSILIQWSLQQQADISYFVVEKSTDGKTYKDAAIIFAAPGNTIKHAYLFNDIISDKKHSVVYYRLRIVDSTQKYQLSEVRALKLANMKTRKISSPYINTITDSLVLTIPKNWQNQKITYDLYNAVGDHIKNWQQDSAIKREVLIVKDLDNGKYLLKANCVNEEFLQRFIKSD